MSAEYELVIIGGGPAGAAASVYASRKRLKTLLITREWGGQSVESADIQNWIGTISISGPDLAKTLQAHVRAYSDNVLDIKDKIGVQSVSKTEDGYVLSLSDETTVLTKTLLIAAGSKRRELEVEGAKEFENKGVTYCASCDGPLFSGMDVSVIGGGNAGFETAAQLLAYAKSVTLLHHSDTFKADPVTVEKVLAHENMQAFTNVEVTKINGDNFVNEIIYREKDTSEEKSLAVNGVFVEIGMLPNTEFASNVVPLDEYNRIKIDPWTQKTESPGVWAAGDCTNILYHQNNIAAGDAVRAVEDIYVTLKTK